MLDLESVTFRNFLSYGDYDTTIPLSKLGPCLVTGPNGAGKSTIVNAILYVFFGRTMHTARPGDRVLNEQTGKNCLVSAKLKNGDIVTRTRKTAGHNELIVERGGEPLLATLSTTPNQQAQLNKLYDLDWHTFCNTSFLTQIGRTWFEMPDPQRKKEIERALRIDRYTLRAQVAKQKLDKITGEQAIIKQRFDALQQQIDSANDDIKEATVMQVSFEARKTERFQQAIRQAREYKRQLDEIKVPDVVALRERWAAINDAKKAVAGFEERARSYQSTIANAEARERDATRRIRLWQDKAGKVCTSCEQAIPHIHTDDKVQPLITEQNEAKAEVEKARAARAKLLKKIETINTAIAAEEPEMNVREAEAVTTRRATLGESARRWAEEAKKIKSEANPHAATITKLQARIEAKTTERDGLTNEVARLDTLVKHYTYIHKAYNDRRRIKSFSVAKFQPLLNSRLRHYLSKFKLDIDIQITDSLGIETSGADYDFMSGGERKRVDVAFMLARFDMQEAVYGRQSNVIVLDEVDGRMDEEGVQCLADVVLNDLAGRVDTILVISHKKAMQAVFPNQIVVEKRGKFSVIGEMR